MRIIRIGLDLTAYVFEGHGVASRDEIVLRKTLRREAVAGFLADLPSCVAGMEACCGAHYQAQVSGDPGRGNVPVATAPRDRATCLQGTSESASGAPMAKVPT